MISFVGVHGGEQVGYQDYGWTGDVCIPSSLRSFPVLHRSRRCMKFEMRRLQEGFLLKSGIKDNICRAGLKSGG